MTFSPTLPLRRSLSRGRTKLGSEVHMAGNSFGTLFKITTWGESHGKALGVVIDGCPPGREVSLEDIQKEMDRRRPGRGTGASPRKERDRVEILSGLFEGKTTGTPLCLLIGNEDIDSSPYEELK